MIQMIAVDPDEQGNGHVRAMLDRLVTRLKKMPAVEYIEVSTYDKAKAELYEHLGFNPPEEVGDCELQAWVLKLPLQG